MKNNITLRDFNKLLAIQMDMDRPRYDKELDILQIVYPEKTEEELLDIPLEEVDSTIKDIFAVPEYVIAPVVIIGERIFNLKGVADINDFKMTYGQYRAFENRMKSGNDDYLAYFLAAVYIDDTKLEDRAEFFLDNMTLDIAAPFVFIIEKEVNRRTQ